MKNIKRDVEQLETAGKLLDKNSPTAARLSLFLLDNLAELVMYKFVREELSLLGKLTELTDRVSMLQKIVREKYSLDGVSSPVKPPKYSANKKRKVLRYFNDKVNFLASDLKKLDSFQGHILKVGHRLRNEAYHNGILRERIIIPITRTYFQIVCGLLPVLWTGGYTVTNYNEVTDFLSKYGLSSKPLDEGTLTQICQIILKGRECEVSQLSGVVSNDLVSRIEKIVDSIEYLARGIQQKSREEIFKWIQFQEENNIELEPEFDIIKSDEELHKFWEKVHMRFSAFYPKVTLEILEYWKKQAEDIKLEASHGAIFAKFNEIDQPLLRIEDLVSQAVFEYDRYMDMQAEIED